MHSNTVGIVEKKEEKGKKKKKKGILSRNFPPAFLCLADKIKKTPHPSIIVQVPARQLLPEMGRKKERKGNKKPLYVGQRSKCISRVEGGGYFVSASSFHHW